MFIYNLKINGKRLTKILFVIIGLIVIAYFLISAWKIYSNCFKVKDEQNDANVINITASNYTNILKSVHENLDIYIGKKICFSGYVYRNIDFKDSQFVLARDMIISSDKQTLIVGFLCDCNKAKKYENYSWVEITGKITRGNYHGEIPVIKIKGIKKIEKPVENVYVYPPDNTYIPTAKKETDHKCGRLRNLKQCACLDPSFPRQKVLRGDWTVLPTL